MAWHRPDDLQLEASERFEYTNAGAHAVQFNGRAGLPVFEGIRDDYGNWFVCHKHKGFQPMSKPEFIWRDAPVQQPVEPPEAGSTWKHHNGNAYGVLLLTNVGSERPEYPPTVVYVNVANGKWYSRPVADWHRSMTEVEDDADD